MTPVLSVEDLVIEFDTLVGRKRVVDGVSFELNEGEVLGILGESGSGKTVSTLSIMGLVNGEPGIVGGRAHIELNGERIGLLDDLHKYVKERDGGYRKKSRSWNRLVRKRMRSVWGSMMTPVFQSPRASMNPLLSIGSQLAESVRLANPGFNRKQVKNEGIRWLERVQMPDPERVYSGYQHELSGGMCQRAMIAVALARKPRILVADEPTTGLDTTVRAEIVRLFRELQREERLSMLYISHDVREVLYLSDNVIVMRNGKVLERSTALDLEIGRGQRAEYTQFLLDAADIRPAPSQGGGQ